VSIKEADPRLEDEDILQMVDAGILPATVGKRPIAEFWAQIYDQLDVHSQVPLRSDGEIAWALRKDAPRLKQVIDEFVAKHRAGTVFGNVLLKRYLGDASGSRIRPVRRNSRSIETWRRISASTPTSTIPTGSSRSRRATRNRS
jgi:membrane-bound lytic murein transglycosylase MltF